MLSAKERGPGCKPTDHPTSLLGSYCERTVARAVRIFRALGDEARLRTLQLLVDREVCVTELAEATGDSVSTVSHRLRLLRSEGLVERRRVGKHLYYSLADAHVIELLRNALDHAEHHGESP